MSTLSLPPPVNSSSGEDTLLAASGTSPNGVASGSGTPNGAANGDGKKSSELLQGVIYPPKEIRGGCSTFQNNHYVANTFDSPH